MAAIAPVRRGNTQRRPFSQRGVKSLTNLRFANESARPLVFALCRLRRPSVPALRIACARASSRFAASNGQRSGRECIFSANASVCSAKNARNDVHAVISD